MAHRDDKEEHFKEGLLSAGHCQKNRSLLGTKSRNDRLSLLACCQIKACAKAQRHESLSPNASDSTAPCEHSLLPARVHVGFGSV